ncbi:MAG: N-acetylmuramoyl-L-alanine amidase, partial [Candidatus Sumerlaeia bacterium]|nr:N-acetylmuramoyl-L-alanine amidase [Candidatus Sumerlaeia bacterium]
SRGTLTMYKHPKDRELALAIYRRVCETGLQPWGVVSSFNSASVKMTEFNTVLIEQAFMSHPEDEALLLNPEFRRKIAQKIRQGLEDYYGKWRDFYLKKTARER